MKSIIYLSGLLFLFTLSSKAQSNNAILFTENGEKFQVILNGVLQNATPETNVKLTGLNAPNYKCRIVFSDTKLGHLDWNMYFTEMGYEATWNIKQNKKGEYVTRMVSAVPIAQAPPSAPAQTVVQYTTTPPPATVSTTTIQQSQTTTTSGSGATGDNVNFNMGVNVGEQGGNISINASGMGMDGMESGSSATTTTTTTTHSVTTTSSSSSVTPGNTVVVASPPPAQVVYVSGYTGPVGCPMPMAPGDFSSMKETIRTKDFENTKLTIAKQVLQNNCLTASQVREVLSLFDFENTKLEYAKYAYDHTYDIGNYYKVNDAFEFESSVDDLNKYISK
ncbi:MAG TPA: DUF4476 domain-containing protein [Bacteroidia bacterium]|nr:DUF4476 domain-containing protein [Bacteroidia bacterium]